MRRWGLSQSKGVPGDRPVTRGGSRGTLPTSGFDEEDLSSAGCAYIQGPRLGVAYAEGGEGALASGSMVSPALAPVRGLWLGEHRASGEPEAGGGRCQPPDDSQCL